jgi:hypothetical protein
VVGRYNRTAPGITQTVIDQGVVLTFCKLGAVAGTAGTFSLPFVWGSAPPPWQYNQALAVGRLVVYITDPTSLDQSPGAGSYGNSTWNWRYVIIPGGVAGGRFISGAAAGYTVQQVKSMSYEQVAALFNIPLNGTNIR